MDIGALQGRRENTQCWVCDGYGHVAKDCPHGQGCYNCGGQHFQSEWAPSATS